MKSIVLIQHCQSQHHVNKAAHLWPDSENGLTELGRRQAECIALRLRDELGDSPCKLYSSDMTRAFQTAEIIGTELGQSPKPVPELREWCGRLAIERTSHVTEPVVNKDAWSLFDWRPVPGGETWREFYARVSIYMDDLASSHDPQTLPILVVHGGTLSNIVTRWLRLAVC